MKRIGTKSDLTTKRKIIIFCELLVLFLVIGSSIAIAINGSSEKDTFVIQRESFMNGHIGGSNLGSAVQVNENLPISYDLRTLDKVTRVKDQGDEGSCWAFATYGSLESTLLPGESCNFSENHMKNLLSPAAPEGYDLGVNSNKGNFVMATAYLARWDGPVNTTDDPYNALSVYSPNELGLPVQKHIQDVYFIPDRTGSLENNEIKSAIMKYGAVATSIYVDNATFFSGNSTTVMEDYNSTSDSYYYSGSSNSTHGVDIVGWDDNYDKNKFSMVPPGNGAFIVKNSWGRQFGDNGYFYVSYYDSVIGKNNAVFTAESADNYQNIYQYDPLGWTGDTLGYNNQSMWCANVFTAKSDEALKAVSFYTTDSNFECRVYIYTDPESGPINQDGPVITQKETIPYPGYHTIRLNSGVSIRTGQKFSVVLKLTAPDYSYPIAIEDRNQSYSSKATANASESFVSRNGDTWTDITTLYSNANICIKAFTDSEQTEPVKPNANFIADVIKGPAPLSVEFTDRSTGSPTSWYWDFGDGSYASGQNVNHTYQSAGSYTIDLTVSNSVGNDTEEKIGYIFVSDDDDTNANQDNNADTDTDTDTETDTDTDNTSLDPGNDNETDTGNNDVNPVADNETNNSCTDVKPTSSKPISAFVACPTSGEAPLKVKFTDKSTGSPTSWKWNFGDGKSSTEKSPAHTYSKAGKYTVTLTTKNADGCSTKKRCGYITVKSTEHSSSTATKSDNSNAEKSLKAPVAAFSATPTTGNAPLKVVFTDKSSGKPTSWKWNFGDGTSSTTKNPTHAYKKAGKYTVSLTVKNAKTSSTKTMSVHVTACKKK